MFYEFAKRALALEKAGKKVVRLNIGDTGLPAPECAIDAACARMKKRMGYGASAGEIEFLEKIAEREGCDVKNVVVGPGSKHLVFALLSVLAKRNAKIAIPAPNWPAYGMICNQLGLRAEYARTSMESNWQIGKMPSDSEIAIICNPLNPTSTVQNGTRMGQLVQDSQENGTAVIIDEAYKGLSFEEIKRFDAIRVRSFSKEFNMENYRLGYVVAPEDIAEKVAGFLQITSTCVPAFVQAAGLACLENERKLLSENRAAWRRRIDAAVPELKKAGFEFATPQSGIYVFATHSWISDGEKFALELLEKDGIAVAAGRDFGGFEKFIRICLNQEPETLTRAIGKMGKAAARRRA